MRTRVRRVFTAGAGVFLAFVVAGVLGTAVRHPGRGDRQPRLPRGRGHPDRKRQPDRHRRAARRPDGTLYGAVATRGLDVPVLLLAHDGSCTAATCRPVNADRSHHRTSHPRHLDRRPNQPRPVGSDSLHAAEAGRRSLADTGGARRGVARPPPFKSRLRPVDSPWCRRDTASRRCSAGPAAAVGPKDREGCRRWSRH